MRLFLSSYRAQGHEKELAELFGKGNKVAMINNAKDGKPVKERDQKTREVLDFLKGTGLKPTEIDLREYFGKEPALEKELSKYPAIWVAGGNTFILRKAMKYSGGDKILSDKVRRNEIMYGGDSAGAILSTPTLRGSESGDEPDNIPEGYKSKLIWDGLNFVSYCIIPHYKSDWWGEFGDKMEKILREDELSYKVLRDGQAIVINGEKEEFLK